MKDVDARHKPGHDEVDGFRFAPSHRRRTSCADRGAARAQRRRAGRPARRRQDHARAAGARPNEPWATGKILVLEPRRIAARAAADRMAKTLGERTGETVGLRVRFGSKISAQDPHRGRDRRRVHPADPRRSGTEGRRGGAVRRIPRALARCRSRPRAGARRAAGPARGPEDPRDVRDHRRRARRGAARRRAGGRVARAAPSRSRRATSAAIRARASRTRWPTP